MAHRFDTGLTRPQRTIIQDNAVSILSQLKRPTGYLLEVIPWDSSIRTYADEDGIADLVDAMARTPSIAVATGNAVSSRKGIGGYQAGKIIDLLVYLASGHRRAHRGARMAIDPVGLANDSADPGLAIVMEHAEELLIGQRGASPSSAIKQIMLDSEEELYTSASCTIWLQTYKVEALRNVSEFRSVDQLLTSIRWRAAQDYTEVNRPAAATVPTSIDVDTDLGGT